MLRLAQVFHRTMITFLELVEWTSSDIISVPLQMVPS